jgi:hypothetical protein
VVSVSNISCSPSLNHLQSMDVFLLVWVPYRAGIFQGRSYEGHVRFFFDRFVGDVLYMFLLRKLMVLLALEQMVLICLPHLRSDEMVHPRYFADVSCSRICPCSV